jgi:flagellar assembly factor FliW
MPLLESKNFGQIPYQPEAVLEFPTGLPGFDERRRFVAVHMQVNEPLVFLQSLEDPELCFITLPLAAVTPGYRLSMSEEDAGVLGLPAGQQPQLGDGLLGLAVVAVKEGGPTANLLAPIVVNLANRRAVQAIGPGSDYSWEHPLLPAEAPACS